MEEPIEQKLEFPKCPNCGSSRRLAGEATAYMRSKGWVLDDYNYYTHIIKGIPTDQRVMNKIPLGSSIPAIWAGMDICLDCGTVWAVKVVSTKGQLTIGNKDKPYGSLTLPGVN